MCHHGQLCTVLGTEPRASCARGKHSTLGASVPPATQCALLGVFGDLFDYSLCLDFFPTPPSFSVYYPSSSIQRGGATPKKAFEKNELAQGKLTVRAMQIDYDFKQKLSICYTVEWL